MIQREQHMKRIRPFIDTDLIKVMTGVRRNGKSVILQLLQQELRRRGVDESRIFSFNFEELRYSHLQTAMALHEEIMKCASGIQGRIYLFFDEIQEVEHWEKCINSLRAGLDCDIYVTGSNAPLLSGELATYLGGRYVEFAIYPFSFSEFLELYHTVDSSITPEHAFRKYLVMGGMPYLANLTYQEEPCRQYLRDLFNSVQLKDIMQRNKIRDADLLQRIIFYAIANIGTAFSANSISRFLKSEHRSASVDTIMNYLKHCCDACLFYQAKRMDLQGHQILATNEKYYMADHGVREAVFGGNMRDINLILENIVFMEALRRGYEVTIGKIGTGELDFVCRKQDWTIYIQTAYLLASEETVNREFGAYNHISDNFPKFVVSMDEFDMSRNGIRHRNIRDFLQEPWE